MGYSPELSQFLGLAYGKIEVKPSYCALATTGFGRSADAIGNPVTGLMVMITGAWVDDPKTGDATSEKAGVARAITAIDMSARVNIEKSPVMKAYLRKEWLGKG